MVHRNERKSLIVEISEEKKKKLDSIIDELKEQNPLLSQHDLFEKKELLLLITQISEQVASIGDPKYNATRFFTKAMDCVENDRSGLCKADTYLAESTRPLKIKRAFIKKIRAITDILELIITPQTRIAFPLSGNMDLVLKALQDENVFFYVKILVDKLDYQLKIHTILLEEQRFVISLLGNYQGRNDLEVFLVLPVVVNMEKSNDKI